jgi:hypothetical protein
MDRTVRYSKELWDRYWTLNELAEIHPYIFRAFGAPTPLVTPEPFSAGHR